MGAGYVGLTTGACLASLGHHVVCCDVDAGKVAQLSRGQVRIHEPGLPELVREGIRVGRLSFTRCAASVVPTADEIFLCVPTPMAPDGGANLAAVESVIRQIRAALPAGCVLVTKSTVPVGTTARLAELVGRGDVAVVSNPEFLREGLAVQDFLHPDRIVLGSDDPDAAYRVAELYTDLDAPTLVTDAASAEMVKYAANCFLATKLSYVNDVAELCEQVGADVAGITEYLAHDRRITPSFLRPGPGWGGSCLPKDTAALLRTAEVVGVDLPLVRAAIDANHRHQRRMAAKVVAACGGSLAGTRLGLLGLTFKAGTDDLRDSPALAVARLLAEQGAELVGYDPALRGDEPELAHLVTLVDDAYHAAKGTAALVLLTDWPEFRDLDWSRVAELAARPVVVDTRNHLDPAALRRAGLDWHGTGRPSRVR
ncbi:UDP-glucose 6-dehydrogenase [Saccharopolyspora subtropica]|uniref:UDP-glucose 6-dehydrogenase n=1 Tax=Saccharopolyspora thermophila TaxID=89367 RepID=A0A917ND45_9PSEU|nr:UDP-glucose 6-dehydrogenase [Saccharopolyspora subtropica]